VAAGVRPGREIPVGSNCASPPALENGAGSAEVSDESALAGAAAGPATEAAAGRAATGAAAVGSAGTSGRVSDAVAPGGGVAGAAAGAAAPDIAVARLCISIGAAEPTVDSWLSSGPPGFTGGAGAKGSAEAVPLSASAETAPAAAIMVETNSFPVRFMVLPIRWTAKA
jgi:hypothetical protein